MHAHARNESGHGRGENGVKLHACMHVQVRQQNVQTDTHTVSPAWRASICSTFPRYRPTCQVPRNAAMPAGMSRKPQCALPLAGCACAHMEACHH